VAGSTVAELGVLICAASVSGRAELRAEGVVTIAVGCLTVPHATRPQLAARSVSITSRIGHVFIGDLLMHEVAGRTMPLSDRSFAASFPSTALLEW
jgi:hypothetical protein